MKRSYFWEKICRFLFRECSERENFHFLLSKRFNFSATKNGRDEVKQQNIFVVFLTKGTHFYEKYIHVFIHLCMEVFVIDHIYHVIDHKRGSADDLLAN